jgi:hypothetical protein
VNYPPVPVQQLAHHRSALICRQMAEKLINLIKHLAHVELGHESIEHLCPRRIIHIDTGFHESSLIFDVIEQQADTIQIFL